jgi:DNA gyrase subunit A
LANNNKNNTDNNSLLHTEDIKKVAIYDEMKKSYLDYAMSVIVSRALPDVRDGLKPVHRRIIYTMDENGYGYSKPFKKSARIVGDVMGKYHPHGDTAIYDSLVRMAQSFSLRLPLVAGQGNFGSLDGDNAAAMRYTEAKMAKSAHALIEDIDKETVDFKPNYDESLQEPVVLPARYPNLLVNGASGIAVGMATNIPTHNLGELIDATLALADNEELTAEDLLQYVKGPDFPTAGRIIGKSGAIKGLLTGRGSITICGVAKIEDAGRKPSIIITQIPWMVNKAKMVEEISSLKDRNDSKELDVISSVRDESDRHGVRVVVELKKDVEPEIVLNYLQKYTSYQVSFGINMLAIHNGIPQLMNVAQILKAFLNFRKEVVKRRTLYLLKKAREKAHILAGLGVAVENIDEVIALIRDSENPTVAKDRLTTKAWRAGQIGPFIELLDEPDRKVVDGLYYLSEEQAKAILDLRLHRLTGLEREKIQADLAELRAEIIGYLEILSSYTRLMEVIKAELVEVRNSFATPRLTQIEESAEEFDEEDFITKEEVALTFTTSGYIKRMPITAYRTQKRGGKGKIGIATKEEDVVSEIIITNSHASLLFFTSKGLAYKLKCYKIPESGTQSLGRAIVNLLPIAKDEKITAILPIEGEMDATQDLIFATKSGNIRRNKLQDFINIPSKGKIAMKLDDSDSLISVLLAKPMLSFVADTTNDAIVNMNSDAAVDEVVDENLEVENDDNVNIPSNNDILINSKEGQALRFPLEKLRVFASRNSLGVRAIKLDKNDFVINVSLLRHEKIEDSEVKENYLKYANAKRRGEPVKASDFNLTNEQAQDLEDKEEFILTVTSKGFGKRTSAYEYRITNRGGKGFLGGKLSEKNGEIIASFVVSNFDEIIIISSKGQVIRQKVKAIRITSRVAQGVMLFRLDAKEDVVSVSKIKLDEADLVEEAENLDILEENNLLAVDQS